MSLSRRKFLRSGTVAALFASLALQPLKTTFGQQAATGQNHEVPEEAKRDRVFYFNKATFTPHLNTDFLVRPGVIVTTLRLLEIEDCDSTDDEATDAEAGECFALTFRADRTLSDLRTIHVFEHAALGEFNLFVSETKRLSDPGGLYYVAVINHRTRPHSATRPPKRPTLQTGKP